MIKNIEISSEQLKAVKILAARVDSNPKRYIEDLVAADIEAKRSEWEFFDHMSKRHAKIDKKKKSAPITFHYRKG